MERENPKPYEVYEHFKGNKYQILTLAKNSENLEMMVVYQALYEPFEVYVRPLAMFMELVDREKYPTANAKYRFTKVRLGTTSGEEASAINMYERKAPEPIVIEPVITKREEEYSFETHTIEIDPGLLRFLDAETYDAKLAVLLELKDKLTKEVLTPMELSLGLEPSEKSEKERYQDLRTQLLTKQKFERTRR